MKTHYPLTNSYPHYAFLSKTTEIEQEFHIMFDNKDKLADVFYTRNAGIYGFTSKEARDKFVRMCNNSIPDEQIAFACAAPIADVTEVVTINPAISGAQRKLQVENEPKPKGKKSNGKVSKQHKEGKRNGE